MNYIQPIESGERGPQVSEFIEVAGKSELTRLNCSVAVYGNGGQGGGARREQSVRGACESVADSPTAIPEEP